MKITQLKPSIIALFNLAFGLYWIGQAIKLAYAVKCLYCIKNSTFSFWLYLGVGLTMIILSVKSFTQKSRLENQSSLGWSYFFFLIMVLTAVMIVAGLYSTPLFTNLLWSASVVIYAFLGYHLWPKRKK